MRTIVFFILLVCLVQAKGQGPNAIIPDLLFNRYSSSEGLPDNRIRSVYQDSRGFLWVGTMNGLSRYDGYTFKKYYNTGNNGSISGNWAFAICEDARQQIWIGTLNGLNMFDPKTEQFTSYKNIPGSPRSLFSNKITSLQFDAQGMLWIGTQNGLARMNTSTGVFEAFNQHPLNTPVSRIIRSQGDYIWIATAAGMVRYHTTANTFRFYPLNVKPDPYGTSFWSILEDNRDLFIATATQGVLVLHYNTAISDYEVSNIVNEQNPELQQAEVFDLCKTTAGDYWLATDHGLGKWATADKKITFYKNNPLNHQSLSNNTVYTVYIDRTDNLWCGTELGLNKLNLHVMPFHYYTFKDPSGEDQVRSIATIDGSSVWIGTAKKACYQYNIAANTTSAFVLPPAGSPLNAHRSLLIDKNEVWLGTLGGAIQLNRSNPAASVNAWKGPAVFAFLKDSKDNIWIGANDGLLQIKKDGSRVRYAHDANDSASLPSVFIRSLYEDHNGYIWVGLETSGVSYLDAATGKFTHVREDAAGNKVTGNIIYSIVEYPANTIWVGSESGLNKITLNTNSNGRYTYKVKNYREQDGLPDKSVNGILPVNGNILWISTIKGLLRFDIAKETFRHYLPGVNCSFSCAWKYNDNKLLFGTSNGFVVFDPEQVAANNAQPEVMIAGLKLFNQEVGINQTFNGDVVLNESITQTKYIELNHKNNVFTIEFIGLHFADPENNRYAYKMEGFDKDWIYTNAAARAVTYTNLDAGTYTFQVKAASSSGVWNERPATLTITVFPPPWKSWWAFMSYVLIAGAGIYLAVWYYTRHARQKNAFETERLLRLKDDELHKEQLTFFTNIAHELQTPLTLINGSIERFQYRNKAAGQAGNRFLSIVHQQSARLTYLVNQLLDFRKAEAGHLRPQYNTLNISDLLTGIARLFEPVREQKELDYSIDIRPGIVITTDKDKLEKIVFNLLSNAFKHTGKADEIIFSVQHENDWLEIEVANSGCTLTEEQLQHIFEDFFVADDSTPDKYSHGIGLAFTKQLVQLLKGSIKVFNDGDWISFQVKLPATGEALPETQSANAAPSYLLRSITAGGEPAMPAAIRENNKHAVIDNLEAPEKPSILIVEDEPSIRFLLRDIFAEQYIVYEAANGRLALEFMQQTLPDIIISDIMMPEVGGLELCNKVKSAPATCHVPFILLSARGTTEQKTEGYDAGADAYIPKPFDTAYLQVRVRKLLEYRQRLLELFRREDIKAGIEEEELEDADKKFLGEIVQLIEEHMDNTELDSTFLEEKLSISKTQLYRKLKALSDMAPSEFIRHVRLQRAAALLQHTKLSVSEIFYKTGFNNRSYFFREFKKRYNSSPKEYREQYHIKL